MVIKVSPGFDHLVPEDAEVERVAAGFNFTEGPLWNHDGYLLFSDIPNSRIVKWQELSEGPSVTTFRHPSGNSNGLTYDPEGRLLACEHGNRRVSRTDKDGNVTVLADRYEGKRLNSPNDVVAKRDGSVYFSDPPYGLPNLTEGKELEFNGVYRVSPDGATVTLLADDFERPNGLAFSPDESVLYIDDTEHHHIRAFDVNADGSLANGRVFAELEFEGQEGRPDGMKVDVEGNVYCAGKPGVVWVFDSSGKGLGAIKPPESPANCAWGGADNKTLFMTANTGLYRVDLNIAGVKVY